MKKSKKINWDQGYARVFSIHKFDIYLLNIEKELKKVFPKGMNNIFGYGRGFDVRWHFDDDQFMKLGEMVLRKTLQDAKIGKNHIQQIIDQSVQGVKKISDFDKIDFGQQSPSELLNSFNRFQEAINSSIPIIYAPVVIDKQLFEYAKKLLATVYQGKELESKWDIIITPLKPIPIVQQEIDLLKILDKGYQNKRLKNSLERIRKKYCWYGMRFVDSQPATIKYFSRCLNNLKRSKWKKRLANYEKEFILRRKNFNQTILPFTSKERRFFKLVNQYSLLRHQRDLYRGSAYYYGHFLYQEIQRRFKMSMAELLVYTVDELKQLLKTGKGLDKKEIQRRKRHFIYLMINGEKTIISQPLKIKKIIKEQLSEQKYLISQKSEVKGNTAYAGKVKGTVRVIHLNTLDQDLKSFKKGEVMVTESTKPEYVPAMRRAVAIITNEGGVTCHAAIVSRELKKPCIIGTKIATKVLKDGDRVEVDAERGIIRILKSAKKT